MLAMEQIQYIKHLRQKEGKSIQAIAHLLGLNWRTAKRYADCEDFNALLPARRQRARPIMEAVEPIVECWLRDDQKLPRKQRHTAKRVYDRLVSEHGFQGAERTVRECVAKMRTRLGHEREVFVQLAHPPAHAQVDFGAFQAFQKGRLITLQSLVLSFPYSNAGFAQVFPGENTECLLEGLKWLFEHLGGVPVKIRFDNLAAAVVDVLTGAERTLTARFARFRLHYGFECEFCTVGRGNEKGHVENKVGYSRRNWFVPVPTIEDVGSFNEHLLQVAHEDLQRTHYAKSERIETLFVQEQGELLSLPRFAFEVVRHESATVDKYGRIKFDGHHYHGIPASPGERVLVQASWNVVKVLTKEQQTLAQFPRTYPHKQEAVNWQELFKLLSRKPRALKHSVHFEWLPETIKRYLDTDDSQLLKQRLQLLSQLAKRHDLSTLAKAITQAGETGVPDEGAIRHALYALTSPERLIPLLEAYTPPCLQGYAPDLSQYDQLKSVPISVGR